ncbi:hypothetical protein BSG1_19717 [Bacillus sp. SG-1]|nr:hypothetical protein BSG1_19717 [Bacillus sp. SG-1]
MIEQKAEGGQGIRVWQVLFRPSKNKARSMLFVHHSFDKNRGVPVVSPLIMDI